MQSARDVEFATIPHVTAKYTSVMGTGDYYRVYHFQKKILLSCKPKRRNRQTK
jgi:hypothetical protein